MTKTITILGSTGSIGRQTLSVADELGLRVAALTAERNVDLMEAQCRKYRPKLAVLADEAAAEELKVRLADMNIRVLAGAEALCEAAALPEADTVVVAVCGFAALRPTLTAIHAKKRIALANKETMVCAGEIMQSAARESGAELAVGITGLAGPGGALPGKPVGTVYLAGADTRTSRGYLMRLTLGGYQDRAIIRTRAALYALDLLRRMALGLEVPESVQFTPETANRELDI